MLCVLTPDCTQLMDTYEFNGEADKWQTLSGGLQQICAKLRQVLETKFDKDVVTFKFSTRVTEVQEAQKPSSQVSDKQPASAGMKGQRVFSGWVLVGLTLA